MPRMSRSEMRKSVPFEPGQQPCEVGRVDPVARRLVAEAGLLVRSAGAIVGGPGCVLSPAVERTAANDRAVEPEPLPVAVHLVIEHLAASAKAAVFVKNLTVFGLRHPAMLALCAIVPLDRAELRRIPPSRRRSARSNGLWGSNEETLRAPLCAESVQGPAPETIRPSNAPSRGGSHQPARQHVQGLYRRPPARASETTGARRSPTHSRLPSGQIHARWTIDSRSSHALTSAAAAEVA